MPRFILAKNNETYASDIPMHKSRLSIKPDKIRAVGKNPCQADHSLMLP